MATYFRDNGVTSLQEVPHFHIHVVPRQQSSDWGTGPPHIAALQPRYPEMKQYGTISWERAIEIAEIVKPNFKG
ncbi:hypothetical protein C6503_13600 [Candidatus Poribacteria bacterium]|nr:MAG: hypothetical protein C6503_13600 [Candidatus Poribacteria bacterium]